MSEPFNTVINTNGNFTWDFMSGFGDGEFCRYYRALYIQYYGTEWILRNGEWVHVSFRVY